MGLEIKLRKRLEGKGATAITLAIQASPVKEAKVASPSPVQEAKDVSPSPPKDAAAHPSMLEVLKQLNRRRKMEAQQRQQQQQQLKYEGAITQSHATRVNPGRKAKDIIPMDI